MEQQTEKKKSFKEQFLDMVAEKYGVAGAAAAEGVIKGHDKQVKVAMEEGSMSAQDMFKQFGIDLGTIEVKGKEGGSGKKLLSELVDKPQPQQSQQQQGYTTKPASSPFGFGGATMQDGQIVEQQPGAVAGLLMTLLSGNPKTSAKMDLNKLLNVSNIQQNMARSDYLKSGGNNQNVDLSSLTSEQQVQAYDLARRIGGVKGAKNILPSIVAELNSGKNIDEVEDTLRYSGQSSEFSGELRNAAQQMMMGKSKSEKQSVFDELDDLSGKPEEQSEYLKEMARMTVPAEMQTRIRGKERTIELLQEIQDDFLVLENAGIKPGFFAGKLENLSAKIGQVKEPALREIATRIATALISYRRDMTGVQFGEKESREYNKLFPGIDKVGEFNRATINALNNVFSGDLDRFYSQKMGSSRYNKLIKGVQQSGGLSKDDIEFMKNYEKKYGSK